LNILGGGQNIYRRAKLSKKKAKKTSAHYLLTASQPKKNQGRELLCWIWFRSLPIKHELIYWPIFI
jgi:hypothetical protein